MIKRLDIIHWTIHLHMCLRAVIGASSNNNTQICIQIYSDQPLWLTKETLLRIQVRCQQCRKTLNTKTMCKRLHASSLLFDSSSEVSSSLSDPLEDLFFFRFFDFSLPLDSSSLSHSQASNRSSTIVSFFSDMPSLSHTRNNLMSCATGWA